MAPITDMGKLNEHLSTRSYFDGGYKASAADCSQLASTPDNVSIDQFPHVVRWRTHIAALSKSGTAAAAGAAAPAATPSPKKQAVPSPKQQAAPKASPKQQAAPAAASSDADVETQIKAVGDEIRVLKEKLKGEGVSGKKLNDHPEIIAMVEKLNALKASHTAGAAAPKQEASPKKQASPKAEPKKEASPKAAPKKEGKKDKKGKKDNAAEEAEPEKTPEELAEERKKKLKKVIKEGGKRGVEIEGAADMGGLQFFCTSVDEPEGDLELLVECVKAMNAKSDPTEEERKGGSGHVGKMVFSAGAKQLAVVAYVPEDKQSELCCAEWLDKVLSEQGGKVLDKAKDISTGSVLADADKGVFPLKIREPMILAANNVLRAKGLFPEDNGDSDDDYVFGDDDFPSM